MTTWLDFRSEPLNNVPEIEIKDNGKILFGACIAPDCKWFQYGLSEEREDFDLAVASHQKWHEDGMPE